MRRLLLIAAAVAALGVGPPAAASVVRGPDLSNNNSQACAVNVGAIHAAGHRFLFVKASEGIGFVDHCFGRYWGLAQHFGMVRGAYDFAHLDDNPVTEARVFLRAVRAGGGGLNRAVAVLDVECSYVGGRCRSAGSIGRNRWWVQTWFDTVLTEGHPAKELEYGGPGYLNPTVGCWAPRGVGLWDAAYASRPQLPCGWGGWDFWQYTDGHYNFTSGPRSIPGVGPVDLSVFSGDPAALVAYTERVPLKPYAHRVLRPGAVGTDVRGLQGAVDRQLPRRRPRVARDGIWGPATTRGVHVVKDRLGFSHGALKSRGCSRACQVYIAHPERRPSSLKSRAARRAAVHHW